GLINIYAFRVRSVEDYKLFLHTTFKKIRKDSVHSLIIDVRGNFGGWPRIASYLFHYISDSYFKTMGKSRMKVSNPYKRNLLDRMPQLRTTKSALRQRRHFIDLRAIMRDPINSYVDEEIFFNEEPKTEIFEFKGDCYLLTNRDSYSAASSFASTFQCYQMGVIIGEETGGTKIFRANAIYEKLMRSELSVGMSTTKLFTTCYNKEFEGIEPTIKFIPSINEIISGMDAQLLFTQRLIKKIIQNKQKSK
ncbi:MAG: S41 family peptidase, partial [Chitinophagales bacterium]